MRWPERKAVRFLLVCFAVAVVLGGVWAAVFLRESRRGEVTPLDGAVPDLWRRSDGAFPFPVAAPHGWKPISLESSGWTREEAQILRNIAYLLHQSLAVDDALRALLLKVDLRRMAEADLNYKRYGMYFGTKSRDIAIRRNALDDPFQAAVDLGHELHHAFRDTEPSFSDEERWFREGLAHQKEVEIAQAISRYVGTLPGVNPRALNTWRFLFSTCETNSRLMAAIYKVKSDLLKLEEMLVPLRPEDVFLSSDIDAMARAALELAQEEPSPVYSIKRVLALHREVQTLEAEMSGRKPEVFAALSRERAFWAMEAQNAATLQKALERKREVQRRAYERP